MGFSVAYPDRRRVESDYLQSKEHEPPLVGHDHLEVASIPEGARSVAD